MLQKSQYPFIILIKVVINLIFLYIVPFVLICFDFLTGFIKAIYNKKLDSTILRKGLFHKLAELLALIGCGSVDYAINFIDLPLDLPLLPSIAIYICIMEIISCCENLCELNPALNNFFAPYLQKLKNETEDKENDTRD